MIAFTNAYRLGFIPEFFHTDDDRPAAEQLNESYAHGGGVNPFEGFTLKLDRKNLANTSIKYPGDPKFLPLGWAKLRDEVILVFEYDWVAIVQPDDSYVITRCD